MGDRPNAGPEDGDAEDEDLSQPPTLYGNGFVCPLCGTAAQQAWFTVYLRAYPGVSDSPFSHLNTIDICRCGVCRDLTIWRPYRNPLGLVTGGGEIIWPVRKIGPRAHKDMPQAVKSLYEEAQDVAGRSPRAAGALLRVAMEALLSDLYPGGDLNDKIGQAVAAGLRPEVTEAMDVLRVRGNFAAHLAELRPEDNPQIVGTLFKLLNMLVERLIEEPRHVRELFDELPGAKKEAIEKRNSRARPTT